MQQRSEAMSKITQGKATILVVEDIAVVRRSVRRMLELHGYRVVEAANVGVATEQIGTMDVALVIADLRLPGIDGTHLVQWLDVEHPALPVLVMTGARPPRHTLPLQGPMAHPLFKPFSAHELLHRVQHLIVSADRQ